MGATGLADASVDIVTGGYALRNAPDLPKTLAEIHRVLKPGGYASFLDFSKPRNPFFQSLELFLLKMWGSFWGLLMHRSAEVYAYIAASLAHYPDRVALRELLRDFGFHQINGRKFFFGVVEVVMFRKA
jgi:demethylmenaquinone methyltransferase/2-methoxy-6-polyprenyl-1,4-benzoquinol methylase